MTGTEKVLQRKDASSVVLAIIVALTTLQFIGSVTAPLSAKILSSDAMQPSSFKDQYLTPFVVWVLQLLAIEILVWVVAGLRSVAYAKPAKKRK